MERRATKEARARASGLRLLAGVPALAGLLAAAAVVLAAGCSSGGDNGAPTPSPGVQVTVTAGETPAPTAGEPVPGEAKPAAAAARRFLDALAHSKFDKMWEMLAVATRQGWGDQAPFKGFLTRKFGGMDLSFKVGDPSLLAPWRNPDTGTTYDQALLVPLRLEINSQNAVEFSLTPLALVKEDDQWRVAGEGPAGRRAPVLPPPPASQKALTVPILAYHHVRQVAPQDIQERTMTMTTAEFEAELAYLRDKGYHTVALSELANALYYDLPLPQKPVALTFDDGYQDAFTDTFPLVQKYGFTATFALPTGLIGGSGYLTWDQAKAMSEAGMEFVSHSVNHVALGGIPDDQATTEVRDSKGTLEAKLGRPVQLFIYPFGEPFAHGTADQQRAVVELLRREGYAAAVTNPLPRESPNVTQHADKPYELKRVAVSGALPLNRFAARLEGNDIR